jgi:Phosphatidate cytidylyltransferase, mitochondrial
VIRPCSGVVAQTGYNYSSSIKAADLPMVDLIFIVNNSYEWHEMNMRRNPKHYTTPIPMSANIVAYIQDNTGAGMWYNAMIPMNIKRFPDRYYKSCSFRYYYTNTSQILFNINVQILNHLTNQLLFKAFIPSFKSHIHVFVFRS